MTDIGEVEKRTQQRVVKLLREQLGYDYLGDWTDVSDCGIRRMKTRWGTCNANAGRILLNLELAKKPPRCIEYIVAHEAMHLVERSHDDRFRTLLDQHFPDWRQFRAELSQLPLSHQTWRPRIEEESS